jgi:WD40 repeat protein
VNAELIHTFSHNEQIVAARFTVNDRHMVAYSKQGVLRLLDAQTGQEIREIAATSCILSSNGEHALIRDPDGGFAVWRIRSESLDCVAPVGDFDGVPVALSPDGRLVALRASRDEDSSMGNSHIYVAELSNGSKRETWRGDWAAFSADSRHVFGWRDDPLCGARTWVISLEGKSWGVANPGDDNGYFINCATFSPDNSILALGTSRGTIALCNRTRQYANCAKHTAEVIALVFSPSTMILASGSRDGTTRIWHSADGELLRTLETSGFTVHDVAFSSDGRHLLTASNSIQIWDVETGEELHRFGAQTVNSIDAVLHPHGAQCLTATEELVSVWDVSENRERYRLPLAPTSGPRLYSEPCVRYIAQGRQIVAEVGTNLYRVWMADSGELRFPTDVSARAFRDDGLRTARAKGVFPCGDRLLIELRRPDALAVVSIEDWFQQRPGMPRQWEIAIDLPSGDDFLGTATLRSTQIASNGHFVLLRMWDKTVKSIDAENGTKLREIPTPLTQKADWIATSPSTADWLIVTRCGVAEVLAWDIRTGTVVWRVEAPRLSCIQFSPDGKYVMLGMDNEVVCLSARDGTERWRVQLQCGPIFAPSIAIDESYLLTCHCSPACAKLWQLSQ